MRLPWQAMSTGLFCFAASISFGQHAHEPEKGTESDLDAHTSVLIGKLVDSTWFEVEQKGRADKDRIARAAANLANGIPAATIPEDVREDGKTWWFLLTNSTGLAP